MSKEYKGHIPVLPEKLLEYLAPQKGKKYIDATFGEGGHTKIILERIFPSQDIKILGIEKDPKLFSKAQQTFKKEIHNGNLTLVHDSYVNIREIAERNNFMLSDGILFDLGMSSWHLEKSGRGFSFRKNEKLDMRYDPEDTMTAYEIVNNWKERKLAEMLRDLGDEKYAPRIARKICERRERGNIKTTQELVEIIREAVPIPYTKKRLHYATRTFQAIRIAVNQELKSLGLALPQAEEILKPNGRLVIISFHSGEDRLIKNFLYAEEKAERLKIITPKAVSPNETEKDKNPRARSALMRAAIKLL